jgi:nucleoside-diphosphate-sugar epimerase
MKNKLLIFGYGYVAKALYGNLKNFKIISTSRNTGNYKLSSIIDFEYETIKKELHNTTHIISTIPPDESFGDPVLYEFTDLIKNAPCLKYICYLSATSVYGNHNRDWVGENSILNIESQRARIRRNAELEWINLGESINIPTIIMRISGIYGPGRNILDKIKDGSVQYIFKEGQIFSRIHIDDIISAIAFSLQKDTDSNIYNLSDNLPSPQHEVIQYAAKLLNIELPKPVHFEKADLSTMIREFYTSSKKVSNKKIKEQLGLKLKYPSYKEGLKSLFLGVMR